MRKPIILLAERDEALRQRLHSFLLNNGFAVLTSSDLTGLLRTLRQQRNVDLLIVSTGIDVDGDAYIGGYDPIFEEGGFSKFIQSENRWVNYSNVDYPVIGHPNDLGVSRVRDIVADTTGKLWMGTWRGVLRFDPAVGPDRKSVV